MVGERVAELLAQTVDRLCFESERTRECFVVRCEQIDAEGLVAGVALVVPQHPVSTVVDDDGREGNLLLRNGGELSAAEQESAVS